MTARHQPPVTLSEAIDYVAAIVATYSFPDGVTGAHHPITYDDQGPIAETSTVRVYTLDGALWHVSRNPETGALRGELHGEIIHQGADWDQGFQAGFADGANDERANAETLLAAARAVCEAPTSLAVLAALHPLAAAVASYVERAQ